MTRRIRTWIASLACSILIGPRLAVAEPAPSFDEVRISDDAGDDPVAALEAKLASYQAQADEEPRTAADAGSTQSRKVRAYWHGRPIYEGTALDRYFFRHTWRIWDGAMAGQNPLWGTPNLVVNKPEDYPHITSLDNDDPTSFWYTMRPNLLNVPVPDEWDWLSMINTERSDFTDLTYTVGKGITYLETGYTYTHFIDSSTRFSQRDIPNILVRYGVTDEFELRLGWTGYTMIDQRDLPSGANFNTFGGDDIAPQFKYELWQQHDWIPMNVLLAGALVPTGTRGLSGNSVQPFFGMIQGWGIRRWLYLKHESGLNYLTQPSASLQFSGALANSGNSAFLITRPHVNQWHESISLIGHYSKHVGGFTEWFTLFGANQVSKQFLSCGLFVYPTPNVQFDIAFYRRVDSSANEYVLKSGFATRW